ncbi:MAG TPA: PEP-CTERM system TPR-repeat protein PrsT, partial [Gammaproteobacteria bacterium]|nr:PEP-CTERM system TPR-repeat protein PrsT [Gammaproteobacteria bacterium]
MKTMKRVYHVIGIALLSLTLLMGCDGHSTPSEHLSRAENFFDEGNYKAASIELKNLLRQNPEHARARFLMGLLNLELKDGLSAEKELNKAKELGVDNKSILPPMARALILQNDYQGVLDLGVDQAQDWEPKPKANFMVSRGLALLALGRKDESLDAIDNAFGSDPTSPYVLLAKARLMMVNGEIAEARTVLNRLFEIKDNYGPAWSFLGDVERFEGNLESAEAAYGKAIEYNQEARTDLLNRAMIRIELNRFEEAQEDIDRLAKLAKNNPNIDYAKGLLHFQRKEYADAQAAFGSVLSANTDYLPAVLYAGIAHFMLGNQETAESYLKQYVESVPNYLPANRVLALIKLRKKEFKAAERLIRNAVGDDEMDVFTLTLLANALLGQNRIPEAMVYLQKVVAIQPEFAPARFNLGLNLLRQGDTEAGVTELETAIELDTELQLGVVQLVVIYLNNKEFDKALETALAYRDQKGDASAYLLLGSVYMARKEME